MRKLICMLLLVFSTVNLAHSNTFSYGPTKSKDRLWRIAISTRPNNTITPQQMMIALYKHNPSAFRDDNINGLYSGMQLRIPTLEDIKNITPNEAILAVSDQNRAWYDSSRDSAQAISTSYNNKFIGMENEVSLLASQVQQYLLQSQQRVELLSEKQIVMSKQLVAMAQSVQSLSDQLEMEKALIIAMNKNNSADRYLWEEALHNYMMFGIAMIGFLLLLFIMTWAKFLRRPTRIAPTPHHEEEVEGEYDFINSTEGIPAKLDLARAYIDMGDADSAKEVLQEIIVHGNEEQTLSAQHLMSHITLPDSS